MSQDPRLADAAFAAKVDGGMLLKMDSAAWNELGVHSALQRSRLLAETERAVAVGKRPPPAESPAEKSMSESRAKLRPYDVKCRCTLKNLTMNMEKGEFQAFIKFEAQWEDPYSEGLPQLANQSDLPDLKHKIPGLKEPFTPRISFLNCVERKIEAEWYSVKDGEGTPVVRWYCFFSGTFNMRDNSLRKFPLDEQMLTIEVMTGWELHKPAGPQVQLTANDDEGHLSIVSTSTISFALKAQVGGPEAVTFVARRFRRGQLTD